MIKSVVSEVFEQVLFVKQSVSCIARIAKSRIKRGKETMYQGDCNVTRQSKYGILGRAR